LHQQITVSVGVAQFAGSRGTLKDLVARADRELYRAKEAGKNRVAAGHGYIHSL
jgi:diguanylate cyclase (GGDEF)-like protein